MSNFIQIFCLSKRAAVDSQAPVPKETVRRNLLPLVNSAIAPEVKKQPTPDELRALRFAWFDT